MGFLGVFFKFDIVPFSCSILFLVGMYLLLFLLLGALKCFFSFGPFLWLRFVLLLDVLICFSFCCEVTGRCSFCCVFIVCCSFWSLCFYCLLFFLVVVCLLPIVRFVKGCSLMFVLLWDVIDCCSFVFLTFFLFCVIGCCYNQTISSIYTNLKGPCTRQSF